MSEEIEVSKYRIVTAQTINELEGNMNALVPENYRYIDVIHDIPETYAGIMGLRSTPDFKMALDFVNIQKNVNDEQGTPLIAKMLREGWTAIANYQKEVALMKVKP